MFAQSKIADDVKVDTIGVSTSIQTYVVFPAAIEYFFLGSEEFVGDHEDVTLVLQAVTDKAKTTSLLVKYGGEFYHGNVRFIGKPEKTFIDMRKAAVIPSLESVKKVERDSTKTLEINVTEKRLDEIMSDPKPQYKSKAVKDESLAVTLTNMRRDNDYLYFKFLFINSSRRDYVLDLVEFQYRDPLGSKPSKDGYDLKNVKAVVSTRLDEVRAKQKLYLGYAIPLFNLSRKGDLKVVFREKNGTRQLEMIITYLEIQESPSFIKSKEK